MRNSEPAAVAQTSFASTRASRWLPDLHSARRGPPAPPPAASGPCWVGGTPTRQIRGLREPVSVASPGDEHDWGRADAGAEIVCVLAGFTLAAYATFRLAPPLTPAGSVRLAAFTVCGLAGAAGGLAAMNLYFEIYVWYHASGLGPAFTDVARIASVDTFLVGLAQSGALLASAAIVYLLAARRRGTPA